MLFNSYIFMLVFLPLTLAGYYLINHFGKYTLANYFVIGMSLWFYGYFNYSYLPIICLSIIINFILSKLIQSARAGTAAKKLLLLAGLLANIGSIFYFKYYDFFIENVNAVFKTGFTLKHLVLPLGISFFTFQQISFIVDSYRGETKDYKFDEYALFVSFFPQLIAGPIVLHSEVMPQFSDRAKRKFSYDSMGRGLFFFSIGLAKKVLIADACSTVVNAGYSGLSTITSSEAWLTSVFYTLQIYFDFSGYSDMAIGLGKMFNIDLPQNFDSPYQSASIIEFWERWHMTLTRFLRTYIYFPLGGSRKGKLRTYLNVMIVFTVSGIWHGANKTFIVWGILHGIFNCLNRLFRKQWEKLHIVMRWALTFLTVNCLWVFFRSDSVGQAAWILKKMFSLTGGTIRPELMNGFYPGLMERLISVPGLGRLFTGMNALPLFLILGVLFFLVLNVKNCSRREFKPCFLTAAVTVLCLVFSITMFSGVSEFLYFDF